ncbi:hypothetical protein LWI29_036707 [Acer saccharum]|uniref:Amidase domain-containing protein n=1 Tax=Acer saccharum TaxID=4024 RepID=A0AA39VYA8_ACESA|nr:hypothetical protein LWI29_036707 [Acer saccharum]
MARDPDYGAFMEKFVLQPESSPHKLPLKGLTFAVKDIFDVDGYVTGFGNPDWVRTHSSATSTAPAVLAMLQGGATSIDRVPGGSSSGSAVAVGAKLVDFSLGQYFYLEQFNVYWFILYYKYKVLLITGTDTGGSVRVPASYCGIFGFRPSHGAVSTAGVIPMAQSFDTVGLWYPCYPTVPGPPPKLQTEATKLESFRARAFSLLSIAGVSGFCQVSVPLGLYDNLPVAVSLLAKHGSDGFLLTLSKPFITPSK